MHAGVTIGQPIGRRVGRLCGAPCGGGQLASWAPWEDGRLASWALAGTCGACLSVHKPGECDIVCVQVWYGGG